jgi:Phosphotransferase enzyme family
VHATNEPRVVPTQDDLVVGAANRVALSPEDGKSGSTFERVTIDGEHYFLKSLTYEDDWISRVIHDRDFWIFRVYELGIMAQAPACIDHAVVGMALEGDGPGARLSILMRDIGTWLVPEGDEVVPLEHHLGFLDHMAALHAGLWGWRDEVGLTPMPNRLRWFAPENIGGELQRDPVPVPIRVADEGWRLLADRAPLLYGLVREVHRDPAVLTGALAATPPTFLHGDWKMGNLGWDAEHQRTILLDWAYPGEGPAAFDLAWYLALNRARLPQSKEAAIEHYRASLERRGIDTVDWWDRQLGLCLLAMMATIAWDKAAGDDDELAWWEEHAVEGARWIR